ncbi:hypothetical protein F2Q68_00027933 [Brassica cretica]|uniref:Uncharacterized protein n=1 Tax=Brassica cretica TaxID=69181 RepID=A0A8S9ICW3_BRACR|nr:hypothetical protein F2Q68_00027933 [Brassica cretica]
MTENRVCRCRCHCPCLCPECRPLPRFVCPYCPVPYSLVRDDPPTSGGFSGYGYSNSSPDRYTVGLNFPDIGSSSRHDDSKEVNEITESVREVNRGLPQWKISRLPTHTYGETPTCGWWWEKKKRYVVCANARSAVK